MSIRSSSLESLPWARRFRLFCARLFERMLMKRAIDRIAMVMGGHIFFVTLAAAARCQLFGLLHRMGPMGEVDVARHLGFQLQPARILLLGCTAMGLIKRDRSGLYSLTYLSKRLLIPEEPQNLLPIIDWQYLINYKALYDFPEALKAGDNVGLNVFPGDEPTLYERLVRQPELEGVFQKAMESISMQSNHMLAEYLDFSNVRLLVDVGGGNGTNIIRLAKRHPSLNAVVFDSPSVCRIAEENFVRNSLSGRLSSHPGNCFTDPFPRDADAILFCHFFTIWSAEKNRELLSKAYAALQPGGAVIVFNMMQDDDRSGPLTAAMGSPYFLTLATGEGMLYTWGEYESWMRDAGFSRVVRRKFVRNHGAIIGIR